MSRVAIGLHDADTISVPEARKRCAYLRTAQGELRTYAATRAIPQPKPFTYAVTVVNVQAPSGALAATVVNRFCADLKAQYGWPKIGEDR